MTAPRPTGRPGQPQPPRPRFEFRARPAASAARRPRAVDVAVGLSGVAAVLALAAAVVMLAGLDGTQDATRAVVARDFPAETELTRDRAAGIAAAVLVGGALMIGPLLAGAGAMLRAGRGGVRFALVVLLVLTAALVVLTHEVVAPLVPVLLGAAVLLGLAAVVAAALPPSSAWLAARSR